jgi:hypothetical protein
VHWAGKDSVRNFYRYTGGSLVRDPRLPAGGGPAKLRYSIAGKGAVYDNWTRSLCVPHGCIPMHSEKPTPEQDPLAALRRERSDSEMDRQLDSIRKVQSKNPYSPDNPFAQKKSSK